MRLISTPLALLALFALSVSTAQAEEPGDDAMPADVVASPAPVVVAPAPVVVAPAPVVVAPAPVAPHAPTPVAPHEPTPVVAAPALVVVERTATWPFTIDLHVLLGAEPHGQGTPIAFGLGAEGLWHGWIGIFVSLLASEGTPVVVTTKNPSLADRISVPIGFAIRPIGRAAQHHDGWGWRLLGGIGLQAGLTIEHLRSTDDDATTAGLHLGLNVDVPLYGGPTQGGVAIRVAGRLMVTPAVTLETNKSIQEPMASAQIFAGICYTP